MWPSCSKDDFNGMLQMYSDISACLLEKTGAGAMKFCTDGDSTRRRAIHAITNHQLNVKSDLGKIIDSLPLVDRKVGRNYETKNYDAKHLAKRSWTSLINGELTVTDTTNKSRSSGYCK